MRNIKLTLEFDGARYKGWQKQNEKVRTIQGTLEKIISSIIGEDIMLVGCGRTDAGVHALNYAANFHTNSNISIDELKNKIDKKLPEDINLKTIKNASERFHTRYNILSKTYLYKINNTGIKDIFNRRYVHDIKEQLNLENMKECSEVFIGTHDFQSFTTLKSKTKSTVRTVNYINIEEKNSIIEIEINGNGFLWNMVRIIFGTLVDAGRGDITKEDVERILKSKSRLEASQMLPAYALYLKDTEY